MSAVMSDDGHDKTEHDSSKQVENDDIGQEEGGVPDYDSDYDWEEALSDSEIESEAKGMVRMRRFCVKIPSFGVVE